jgi:lysophospholipase L1-like esterase
MTRYDPAAGLYLSAEPNAVAPVPSAERLEQLIRFEHAPKRLATFEFAGPLSEEAEAALHLTSVETFRAVRSRLRSRASTLGADLRAGVAGEGDIVVALGDSITDDLVSWAEILRGPLERAGAVLVNAGLSGDTTTDLLRRLYGVVELAPTLVITMIGTNDAQRHGGAAKPLVSAQESAANLHALRTWLRRAGARTAWITPPPVDEAALATAISPRPFEIRNTDLRRIAEVIHAFPDPVIDGGEAVGDLLLDDGVHPSEAGQAKLAAAVAQRLSQNQSGTGKP